MPRKSAAKKKQAAQSLFGFDDDEHGVGDGQAATLNINESFAKRFEHNKKREELHRLKEKFPEQARRIEERGIGALMGGESSSSSEDEEDGFVSQKTERQILETIWKIRTKDKSIYDPESRFYSDDEAGGEGEGGEEGGEDRRKKKDRPLFLKDVMYKEAMDVAERGGYSDDDDGDDGGDDEGGRPSNAAGKSYVEEQADLKQAFLTAFDEDVEGVEASDGVKNKGDQFGGVLEKSGRTRKEAVEMTDAETQRLVDRIFSKGRAGDNAVVEGEDGGGSNTEPMTANDRFLRDYILNQAWMKGSDDEYDDPDLDGGEGSDGEEFDEQDEQAYQAAEHFEANYNFRFEEPGGAEIVTYPRQIEGTVRKKDDRRAQKRQEKAARKAAEEEERRRELKQLKNLKKMEIEDKLSEIKHIAGSGAAEEGLIGRLLDGEFDPEAHDKAMAQAFGDDYYDQGDEDEDDLEDEEFDRKLAAMAEYPSDEETHPDTIAGMLAKRKAADLDDGHRYGDGDGDGDGAERETENGKVDTASAKRDVKKLLDEYYKLDYEDYVGGVATRFRYRQVEPETFGLSFEEILMMDDKELNQVMGMKRVAATYHDGPKRRPNYGKLNDLRKSNEEKYKGKKEKKEKKKEKKEKKEKTARRDVEPFTREDDVAGDGSGDFAPPSLKLEKHEKLEKSKERQTETERRLDTFKKPSLKNRQRDDDGNGYPQNKKAKKAKRAKAAEPTAPTDHNPETAGMTKAQRRNRRRALQRAQKAAV